LVDDDVTCTMLFFAAAADAMDSRDQTLTIPMGSTVGDAFETVSKECHALASLQSICAFAIDEQLVQASTKVTDGCTIAVLPPVSGG
jgi:molybdopterin converting factor subunit 1